MRAKSLLVAAAATSLAGCVATASVASATVGLVGSGAKLAGKTVYYTGKGAVGLVSGNGDSVPVTIADDIGNMERGELRLITRYENNGELYTSDRVIAAGRLERELDALSRRDDVVDVYIDRP